MPERLYNLSRVETFYQHRQDEVALVPVFAAFVAAEIARAARRRSTTRYEWLPPAEARARFAWPRERRALEDAVHAARRRATAGAVEDVLRVC